MLFLLGLFLGCVLGFFIAGLCHIAGVKDPDLSAASNNPEVIEGAV